MSRIYFHSDAMYRHNILQIPYVTYDGREEIDTINPNTSRRDFMCLSDNTSPDSDSESAPSDLADPPSRSQIASQYLYGRVIGIFHANVMYHGSGALDYRRRRFDFLWVRWFRAVPSEGAELWSSKRLERIKLAPIAERDSWGFLDPSRILRGAHIIPQFALGPLNSETPAQSKKIFSKAAQEHLDWSEYYVNRYSPPFDT